MHFKLIWIERTSIDAFRPCKALTEQLLQSWTCREQTRLFVALTLSLMVT